MLPRCQIIITDYAKALIYCKFAGRSGGYLREFYMSEKTILVWFRNDLRVHDNEILLEAVRKADKVLPVYMF